MSDVMEKDVREIKVKVGGIEKGVDLLLRANRKEILEDLMQFFGKSHERIRVFLAVDGERSVGQLADFLHMKVPNVSRRISELEREILITLKVAGSTKVYMKTEKVEILKLEKELVKKFGDLSSPQPQTTVEAGGEEEAVQDTGTD